MKKILSMLGVLAVALSTTSCGSNKEDSSSTSDYKVAMVSDLGGINDQSFNQSAWEGLQELEKETGAKVSYIESTQNSDYITNLERLTDSGNNLVWAIGYSLAQAVEEVADKNPDVSYAIADFALSDDAPSNTTSVEFYSEQPSFLVGYVAGKTTKTNKVGFVGGIDSAVISQFRFGYEAGVRYAQKELGKSINVEVQYAETFSDSATGKAIASKMFSDGCDIVFHAAGKVGDGVISAAVENGKFAIGVDRDQSDKAPNNVLISAIKHVGKAVKIISKEFIDGKDVAGKKYKYGLKEECVGIPAKDKCPNVEQSVYDDAIKVKEKIMAEEIDVPYDSASYQEFLKSL